MKRLTTFFLSVGALVVALTSCCGNAGKPAVDPDVIESQLKQLTLREKVGQLFCVRPEAFDVALEWDNYAKIATYQLQEVNEQMVKVNAEYPCGGIILFAGNIKNPSQIKEFNSFLHDLLAVTVVVDYASQKIFDTEEEMMAYVTAQHEAEVLSEYEENIFKSNH